MKLLCYSYFPKILPEKVSVDELIFPLIVCIGIDKDENFGLGEAAVFQQPQSMGSRTPNRQSLSFFDNFFKAEFCIFPTFTILVEFYYQLSKCFFDYFSNVLHTGFHLNRWLNLRI